MKDKLVYLVLKLTVSIYEKIVVKNIGDGMDKYQCIQEAHKLAYVLSETDDVKYIELSNRLARANYVALVNMFSAEC